MDEFPWQVSLKSFGSHICGGSVVNKNQIITAAHCCQGQLSFLDSIVAGAHDRNLESGHQTRAIQSMEYHESWNTPDFDHDICIVTLKEPLNLDDPNVAPIDFFSGSRFLSTLPSTASQFSKATSPRTWSVPAALVTP